TGKYELAYAGSGGPAATPGPSPYYELRGLLFSGNIGSTNYSRYKSASTDSLFNQYSAASPAQQQQLIKQIQKGMGAEGPLIPTPEESTGISTTPRISAAGRPSQSRSHSPRHIRSPTTPS